MYPRFTDSFSRRVWSLPVFGLSLLSCFLLLFNFIAQPRMGIDLWPWRENKLQLPYFESTAMLFVGLILWAMCLGSLIVLRGYLRDPDRLIQLDSVPLASFRVCLSAASTEERLTKLAETHFYARYKGRQRHLLVHYLRSSPYPEETAGHLAYIFAVRLVPESETVTRLEIACAPWSGGAGDALWSYVRRNLLEPLLNRPQVKQFLMALEQNFGDAQLESIKN